MAAGQMLMIGISIFPSSSSSSPLHRSMSGYVDPIKIYPSRSFTKMKLLVARTSNPKPDEQEDEDKSNNNKNPFFSPEDLNYLWKLGVGSFGGAAVIKYGSILLPEITRPNIMEALIIISAPVVVAVLLLIKQSRIKEQN
ncbi:hypothetical protein BVC80_9067g27 [Macleaya cordata]|uniref:Uncharacterized protein n=1 Tax=Macleaya cordata TaxID=56857 RepID=A0A200PNR8_MACCD|nr:hypothetical protein BVC80_9067g27 [Macleaya cordata]